MKTFKEFLYETVQTTLHEKLDVSDGLGVWIKDFQNSEAPQFKNADKNKRRDMAIAAFVAAGGSLDEKAGGLKDFTKLMALTVNRKTYSKAKELVKRAIIADRENKHSLAYHASNVVRKYNLDVDPIVLRDLMLEDGYEEQ